MNIYELITPSDPITFKAEDDKVAFFCALYLGKGKAGCDRCMPEGYSVNMTNPMYVLQLTDYASKN